MAPMKPEEVKELLRQVRFPGRSRDVVALGFVKSIAVQGKHIEIEFTPDTINAAKVTAMEDAVRVLLHEAQFEDIEIHTEPPYDDDSMLLGGASVNPLQVDLHEYGLEPSPDPDQGGAPHLKDLLARGDDSKGKPKPPIDADAALAAALEMAPPEGPQGNSDPTYKGPLPVFQWQLDPDAPEAETFKAKLSMGSWNFVVWWLVHPVQELTYASIQARHWIYYDGKARPNPAGRIEAVNLVYDPRRTGIVAIYGTVKDFRPFVDAFHRALSGLADGSEDALTAETALA